MVLRNIKADRLEGRSQPDQWVVCDAAQLHHRVPDAHALEARRRQLLLQHSRQAPLVRRRLHPHEPLHLPHIAALPSLLFADGRCPASPGDTKAQCIGSVRWQAFGQVS